MSDRIKVWRAESKHGGSAQRLVMQDMLAEIERLEAKVSIDKITMDNFLGQIKSLEAKNAKLQAVVNAVDIQLEQAPERTVPELRHARAALKYN